MRQYHITSGAGVDMGIWEAEDAAGAMDAMARDAGYADQADVERQGIATHCTVEEVEAEYEYAVSSDVDGVACEPTGCQVLTTLDDAWDAAIESEDRFVTIWRRLVGCGGWEICERVPEAESAATA